MRLPQKINPCPIREAVAEIRFNSNVPDEAVFGIAYQALSPEFQNPEALPMALLPSVVRNDKNLLYQAHFRLSAPTKVALIGPKVIAVGLRGEYPGWPVLSAEINKALIQFHRTGIVAETLRVGLRYINFFDFDIYKKISLRITRDGTPLDGEQTFIKTVLARRQYIIQLQIGQGMALVSKPEEAGSVIDIDVSAAQVSGTFSDGLNTFLEEAHAIEKEMFFELLKPDFLETLKPIYPI